jgi:hypothetical protein
MLIAKCGPNGIEMTPKTCRPPPPIPQVEHIVGESEKDNKRDGRQRGRVLDEVRRRRRVHELQQREADDEDGAGHDADRLGTAAGDGWAFSAQRTARRMILFH